MFKTLWLFSRPHTIIGTTLSVISLYLISVEKGVIIEEILNVLIPSLVAALACNVYITGLNQVSDIEVDKINKPHLPIPSGKLSVNRAKIWVIMSLLISLSISAFFGFFFFFLIFIIAAIGTLYSLPPVKFKRHHLGAAMAISVVRGFLINVGFYVHFQLATKHTWNIYNDICAIAIFMVLFSIGIAWFKDIPDEKGDMQFQFETRSLKIGRKKAFYYGVILVILGYLVLIVSGFMDVFPNSQYQVIMHIMLLFTYIFISYRISIDNLQQVKRYYRFFWVLFFLEYLLLPVGYFI